MTAEENFYRNALKKQTEGWQTLSEDPSQLVGPIYRWTLPFTTSATTTPK